MRKVLISLLVAFGGYVTSFAQIMEDNFDSNQYNWSELSNKRGKALIQNGVMHLDSRTKYVLSTCYAPIDVNRPFILSVEAVARKIDSSRLYGILLDYEDDQNFILFYIKNDEARLEVCKEDKVIGYKRESLKLRRGRNVGLRFEIEYNLNELIFKVNGVRAMSYRRRIAKDDFLLGTSGIGFYTRKGMIDFDNLKVMQ
jgi:hypothetical protein